MAFDFTQPAEAAEALRRRKLHSHLIGNLLLRTEPEFYRHDFDGEDIFVFSGSLGTDRKLQTLIEEKDVPDGNVFPGFDDEVVDLIFDRVKEEFDDAIAEGKVPKHSLIILDDCRERVYSPDAPVEEELLGLYVVRGDMPHMSSFCFVFV